MLGYFSRAINRGPISQANRKLTAINQELCQLDELSFEKTKKLANSHFDIIHKAYQKISEGKSQKPEFCTAFTKSLDQCYQTLKAFSHSPYAGDLQPYFVKAFLSLPEASLTQDLDKEGYVICQRKFLDEGEEDEMASNLAETASLSSSSSKSLLESLVIPGIDDLPVNNEEQKKLKEFVTQHLDSISTCVLKAHQTSEVAHKDTKKPIAPCKVSFKERFSSFFTDFSKPKNPLPDVFSGAKSLGEVETEYTPYIDIQSSEEKAFQEKLSKLSSYILEKRHFHNLFFFGDIQSKRTSLLGFDPGKGLSSFTFVKGQMGTPWMDKKVLLLEKDLKAMKQELLEKENLAPYVKALEKNTDYMQRLQRHLKVQQDFRQCAIKHRLESYLNEGESLEDMLKKMAMKNQKEEKTRLGKKLEIKKEALSQLLKEKSQEEQSCLTLTFEEKHTYQVEGKELIETLTYLVEVPFKTDQAPSCMRLPEAKYFFI